MQSVFLCVAGLLLACSTAPAQTNADFPDSLSLASELHRLEYSLTAQNAPQLRAALPSGWRVRTLDGDYFISTTPLKSLLDRSSSNRAISGAQNWLDHLATQLASYRSAAHHPAARADLMRILARPEFAANAPPNAWERFWERLSALLTRWIERLFALARVHSTTSFVFFWLALAGAVSLLAFFLVRLWLRDTYRFKLSGSPSPLPARTSQHWLQAARAASNSGDLPRAIQCAYWAGVAHLQESRALPESTTYTPREYLRALASALPNAPAEAPLRVLTSHLERFWYARSPATAQDFSLCLASLEDLGCQMG